MTRLRFGLATRLTLLLIATVIAGQLINALILVRVESNLRTERIEAVAAERIVQAIRLAEFAPNARRMMHRRRGFRIVDAPPTGGKTMRRAEALLRDALVANGFEERAHTVASFGEDERFSMIAGVELEAGSWLLLRVPLPRPRPPWTILGLQTLVLTIVLLIPAIWIGRAVAMPLRRVTAAADNFLTGKPSEPLPSGGPPDVDALCRAFEALEQRIMGALEERSVMLGAIGHDLRTPLASLRIRVESVEEDSLREAMITSIDDLARALDDILAFSSETGAPVFEVVRTEALVARLSDAYPGGDLKVISGPSFRFRCTPESVLRALRNLVDNAVRYGGGATLVVTTTDGEVVFTVTDDGPGMPQSDIERLQKPFTRAEGSRNRITGGTGLGLAIVKAVATAHHGRVHVENRPAGGLSAALVLPAEGPS